MIKYVSNTHATAKAAKDFEEHLLLSQYDGMKFTYDEMRMMTKRFLSHTHDLKEDGWSMVVMLLSASGTLEPVHEDGTARPIYFILHRVSKSNDIKALIDQLDEEHLLLLNHRISKVLLTRFGL